MLWQTISKIGSIKFVLRRVCLSKAALIHVLTKRSSRLRMPVGAAGRWRRIGGELLDKIDHLGASRGRKPDEGFQKPQALDRFAGWIAELLAQFRSRSAIGHLALFSGSTQACRVEIMPRNNPTGKANSTRRLRKGPAGTFPLRHIAALRAKA